MSYKALYREYRPQTFDEVIGQKYIVQTLKNAIENDKIAHAYLFTGPRGTGKTTVAKLIAKGINCSGLNKPCGECENCKSIAEGTYPDVIEIDAASNNSVDEVRDLIEKVKYTPLNGKYKVYIIDEVHMMSSSAFNALLKTLEEPPAHAVFILATTEVNKVLPTIISRCQRFDFAKISKEDIEEKIKYILNKENINYDNDVPSLIADLCDGGARDAIGILDQTIAYASNNLTCKDVRDIYGILSNSESIKFIKELDSSNVVNSLNMLEDFDKRGIDLVRFTNNLIDILKDYIVYMKSSDIKAVKVLKEDELNSLMFMSCETAFKYLDLLIEASLNYKKVSSVKSMFELTILKICDLEHQSNKIEYKPAPQKVIEEIKKENIEEISEEETIDDSNINQVNDYINEYEEEINVQEEIKEELVKEENIEEEIKQEPVKEELISNEPLVKIENIVVDSNLLINYLCMCNKESKTFVTNMWQSVSKYLNIPRYQNVAKLLRDCSIAAAGSNCIIFTTDAQYQADEINGFEKYFDCKDFILELLGNNYYFVAITADTFKSIKLTFMERAQCNALPLNPILKDFYEREEVLLFKKQEINKSSDVKEVQDIFGNLLTIKD